MPMMPRVHRAFGVPLPVDRYASDYRRRGTRQEQGYTNDWLRAAQRYRSEHPLCVMCAARGRVVPCQCVDHVIPHGGVADLFWDETNWQALCNACHRGPKRVMEVAFSRFMAQTGRVNHDLSQVGGVKVDAGTIGKRALWRIFAAAYVNRGGPPSQGGSN